MNTDRRQRLKTTLVEIGNLATMLEEIANEEDDDRSEYSDQSGDPAVELLERAFREATLPLRSR